MSEIMWFSGTFTTDPLYIAYLTAFSLAGVICLVSLRALPRVEDVDTRRGLGALLLLSAGWSFAHVGYLLPFDPAVQSAIFLIGLVLGIAAVGPWLYFCSAYTGRSLHRHRRLRSVSVAVFLLAVAVKVTNPIHEYYFVTEVTSEPFVHLAIHHEPLHWMVMGLAYALAIVGIAWLFELFWEVSYDTRVLYVIVGLTGLPVVLDLIGAATPYLIDVTHSPLGVAVFAVGILFVFTERFQTIQLTPAMDNPTIILDSDRRLHEWNRPAEELFPALAMAADQPIGSVLPDLAGRLDDTDDRFVVDRSGVTRYYRITKNPFSADYSRLGMMIILTDVTEREHYRHQLEAKNNRLDEFASMVSHDLRNPLTIATGHLELTRETGDLSHLDEVELAHGRMLELIEDLLTLARSGLAIDEMEAVDLGEFARECWGMIEAGEAQLVLDDTLSMSIEADRERLRQLFENIYRNAIEHGGLGVTISIGPLDGVTGFYIEDDGEGIPADFRSEVFESGFSTREEGTGFGLSIVADIARAHGWSIQAVEAESGGARFEITGVELANS